MRAQPPELWAFLNDMPKGGDLHSHLSGAIYAESMIGLEVEDGLCVDTKRLTVVKPPPRDATPGMVAAKDAQPLSPSIHKVVTVATRRRFTSAN